MRIKMSFMAVTALCWSGVVAAGTVNLSSLPCGDQAIKLGMSPQDIQVACGQDWQPSYVSKHERPALGTDDGSSDHFEKWMYRTAGESDAHVIIKNGEVVKIFTIQ